MSKYIYQGWKGFFTDHYFGHLEKGEWVEISYWKYFWLNLQGFEVRKIKKNETNKRDNTPKN